MRSDTKDRVIYKNIKGPIFIAGILEVSYLKKVTT